MSNPPFNLSSCKLHQISYSQPMPRLMTDEGSAYPTVVAYFGWNHVLDRYHFHEQISTSWEGLDNAEKFRQDIIDILDSCTERQYIERMSEAQTNYTTRKAKISWTKSRCMTTNSCMLLRQTASLLGTFPRVKRKV